MNQITAGLSWLWIAFEAQPVLWLAIFAAAVYGRMAIKKDVDRKDAIAFGVFLAVAYWFASHGTHYPVRKDDFFTASLVLLLLVWAVALALPQDFPASKWGHPGGPVESLPFGTPLHRVTGRRGGGRVLFSGAASNQEYVDWTVKADASRKRFFVALVATVVMAFIFAPLALVILIVTLCLFVGYCWLQWRRLLYWPHYAVGSVPVTAPIKNQQPGPKRVGGGRNLD